MATGPNTVVFSAMLTGNFYFKEYNLETGQARDTLVLEAPMLMFVVCA